jgi:outer membrane protein OmpA-like peptidoglycan-associated protein
MKTVIVYIAAGWMLSGQTPAQPAARPPIASVESRWENVYCDLTELARTSATELTVRYQYRNTRKEPFRLPNVQLVSQTRVFDPLGPTLFGVLKDADGRTISSTMLDGSLSRPIRAGGTQAHWARLEPPGEAVKAVTVLVEGCLPFDGVAIGGGSTAAPLTKPAAAIASQPGDEEGLVVEVTRLERTAGGFLAATVRYRNTGAAGYQFPNAGSAANRRLAGAYAVDSATRRKYEVARTKDGRRLSSETLGYASSLGETLAPGEAMTFWAMFPAPAEGTKTLSLYLPLAPPFDGVPIAGAGPGSTAGSAIAGAVVGVDAALKDLGAKVSDTEIRIDLAADVLFDFDKATIKKEAEPSLRKVATVLGANPGAKVAIEGHTDAKGADAYNQTLSEQRAASVKQWLVANAQVDGAAIATRGWGKTKPVAHNTKPDGSDDPDGRAKNRRVEIVVRK